jgi:hypothetical protein
MPKTIGILQSNYIPWKGYFDIIRSVDEFVLYDDAQFTRGEWRHRNKIKTKDGLKWLTIPVEHTARFPRKIKDTLISDLSWTAKHWDLIRDSYSRAEFFKDYRQLFEELYLTCTEEYLSRVNYRFLKAINKVLGIETLISCSSDFTLVEGRNDRLLSICKQAGADRLLLGPAAQVYLDETLFRQEGIEVEWMDYSGYPEYRQLFPPFEHAVTILDLIFNEGPNAKQFMKNY